MEIVDVSYLGTVPDYQSYSLQELSLITTSTVVANFGAQTDYVEFFIKDLNGDIVARNYNATKYVPSTNTANTVTATVTSINLDPEQDVKDKGINRGSISVKYNFFKNILESKVGTTFWIKEISPSRTEIKVGRQDLANSQLLVAFNTFNSIATTTNYYPDFFLNFGEDNQIIAINLVYVEEDGIAYLIVKLHEPLPGNYDVYSQFWAVQKVADSVEFDVTINVEAPQVVIANALRGPNYKVAINQKQNQTTPYYNYTGLFSTTVSSSYQQMQSMIDEKSIDINVDYSSFSNFIHFSSATERLLNFEYKLRLIEAYNRDITLGNSLPHAPGTIINNTNVLLQQNIDNIITKFDNYEYYLYFESGSTAWPKKNNSQPYILYSVTSSQALDWMGSIDTIPSATNMSMLYSASLYDNLNKDNLEYSMPAYIREDSNNEPYMTFLNMIGQHFDNIWIYYKDVSNRYSAENNPAVGISIDVVADALRGFGIELYTNSNVSDNIYYSLFGINESGSNLPITSSAYAQVNPGNSSLYPPVGSEWLSSSLYLPPFGNEKINRYVTDLSFSTLPPNQTEKEIYKRLYHNLPYLLKTKGTQRGVKALIACYGIPNTTLTVNEFGGNFISAAPGIQQIQNEKVFTGSILHISSSLLSPFVTNQFFQTNLERGSVNVEVGFSPADSINADITGSLGNFNIMQYIGAPALQYSSSYDPLVTFSDNYFAANYTSRYNVWDFIRIIKYYNNSLFKMIKDFVPARANLSTGIIVKPHILERNKYARHEPTLATLDYSQSIDTAFITASDAPVLQYSTAYTSSVETVLGPVEIDNSYGFEKYTGDFGGTTIQATTDYFPQVETSNMTSYWTSSVQGGNQMYLTYSLDYLYNNVSGSPKSTRFLECDYNHSQIKPSNFNLITQSINTYPASITDPYGQYAEIQDYNYYLRRSIIPRYSGSYMSGRFYNTHSAGDISYGNEPVINYYNYQLGLFTQLATSSYLPGKINATLSYLVDVSGGLFELNQNNRHWVDVQNIFKLGGSSTIKQWDNQKYSNQKATDGVKYIWNSGYSYRPMLYFGSSSLYNPLLPYLIDATMSFETTTLPVGLPGYRAITGLGMARQVGTPQNPGDYTYAPTFPGSMYSNVIVYDILNDITSPGTVNDGNYVLGSYNGSFATGSYYTVPINNKIFGTNAEVQLDWSYNQPVVPTTPDTLTISLVISGSNPSDPNYQYNQSDSQVIETSRTDTYSNATANLLFGIEFQGVLGPYTSPWNTQTDEWQLVQSIQSYTLVQLPFKLQLNFLISPYNTTWNVTNNPMPTIVPSPTVPGQIYTTYGTYRVARNNGFLGYDYSINYTGYRFFVMTATGYEPVTSIWDGIQYTPYTNQANPYNIDSQWLQEVTTATVTSGTATLNIRSTVIEHPAGSRLSSYLQLSGGDPTHFDYQIKPGGYVESYGSSTILITSSFDTNITTPNTNTFLTDINTAGNYFQLTAQLVPFYNNGYTYNPIGIDPGLATQLGGDPTACTLYDVYGDVVDVFNIEVGDYIIIQTNNLVSYEYEIARVDVVPNVGLNIYVKQPIQPAIAGALYIPTAGAAVRRLLILKRYKDEQNVILQFPKKSGATSYGFLIPDNINPVVVDDINTLQATVQTQLLSTQANSGQ